MVQETNAARALAAARLEEMGPLSRREGTMLAIFTLVLALWLTGEWHGVPATSVALLGVSLLLLTRVLEWHDLVEEKGAWDAFIWFGGLVTISAQLERAGLPKAFAGSAAAAVAGWSWWWALAALLVIYLYAHYAFASLVAHVTADTSIRIEGSPVPTMAEIIPNLTSFEGFPWG